jgi:hypothetical protein
MAGKDRIGGIDPASCAKGALLGVDHVDRVQEEHRAAMREKTFDVLAGQRARARIC